jgi:hypothetical protein
MVTECTSLFLLPGTLDAPGHVANSLFARKSG